MKKATSRTGDSAKKKSTRRNLNAKGKVASAPKTVDAYLARIPEPARGTLQQVRAAIRVVVPAEATEAISYGIPAFQYKGTLVWFAAFSDHCSFFPTARVMAAFRDELRGYKTSKGTIQFPLDNPLPAALVKKMVRMRLAEKQRG